MKKIITFMAFTAGIMTAQAQQTASKVEPVSKSDLPVKVEAPVKVADQISAVPAITKAAEDNLAMKETEYNFAKIPQGKPVTHVFEVMNSGKEPLKIDNVQASCGCTTPEWEHDKVLAPGASTKITVGYNAAAEGVFTKSITITYNGSLTKQLLIKGEVWKTPAESAPVNKAVDGLKN